MIEGILIEPLKVIADDRGAVMHMLRNDAGHFTQFGEIYFSVVNPGIIKGWKKHSEQTQNFAVVEGNIQLVLYDARDQSSTKSQVQEITIGVDHYQLVRIPPGVIYAFKALGDTKAIIANCADLPHSPQESETLSLDDKNIPYSWNV